MRSRFNPKASDAQNLVDALDRLSESIESAARSIGMNPGGETPGTLEFIGMQLRDGVKVYIENDSVEVSLPFEVPVRIASDEDA